MAGRPEMDLPTDEIVDAAIAILDEGGLAAVSMRRVATSLGVSPVPLYSRIGNKEALLEAMAERLLAGMAPPVEPGESWTDYAARWARAVRARLLRTADMRTVGLRRWPFVEASRPLIETLRAHGFEADEAVQACRLILWAVAGFATTEHRRPPTGPSGRHRRRPGGDPAGVGPEETDHLFDLHIRYLVEGIVRDRRGRSGA